MQNFSEDRNRDEVVVRLQAEFLRVQDLYLRALADLDNFRKKGSRITQESLM